MASTTPTHSLPFLTPEDLVPPVNRGLKVLDKSLFTKKFNVWSVTFPQFQHISDFLKNCKDDVLKLPKISPVTKPMPENNNMKSVLLTERLVDLSKKDQVLSKETLKDIDSNNGKFQLQSIELDYSYWKAEQILKAILPVELHDDVPSSFTVTGHLAHLNLREEFKPYDRLIGQVILDKNTSIKTVVDKVGTIDTTFRTFEMKVIAGKPDMIVELKESDCIFNFDFSKVYWNSRLSTEHNRIVSGFQAAEAVCDVMAGVGPFAVPAGKKKCLVFANDLNPNSFKYLSRNITKNKVQDYVVPFNQDGRDFIKSSPTILQQYALENPEVKLSKPKSSTHKNGTSKRHCPPTPTAPTPTFFSHYVMNLPDSAITFVDSYIGLFSNAFPQLTKEQIKELPGFKLPIINVHHFEKFEHTETPTDEELHKRVHSKLTKLLNYDIPFDNVKFHLVRMVAPTKPMYCVSFELPEEVAFA
ncbi:hypothetical protein CANARDRAFT_205009 [[Candida] arabinofermentans NRRL YB-2248]|uniref:tRNA (guanine(37)-N1)-methyltransferase n=1 Tax=[Candida] arabinofermentans NRRL YB-2248 TaxID=983967 RepID=A0A1E4SSR3_9ASCO|nr:hypothetical protein CANARDRAFT_205009 [[Candida] arabinofermentans NRRL YB-2248]